MAGYFILMDPLVPTAADPKKLTRLDTCTMSGMNIDLSAEPNLEARIVARRTELIARLVELKPDKSIATVQLRDQLKAKLSELAHIVKEGVVDGWAAVGEPAVRKLDRWLVESAAQLGLSKKVGPS
jgi:hypothetical protein